MLNIIAVAVAPILGVWGWVSWLSTDRQGFHGTRKVLFTVGLGVLSLALAWYALFVAQVYRIGGFGNDFASALRWARPGFWFSTVAIPLCAAGRGRSRLLTLVSSLLVAAVWVVVVEAM